MKAAVVCLLLLAICRTQITDPNIQYIFFQIKLQFNAQSLSGLQGLITPAQVGSIPFVMQSNMAALLKAYGSIRYDLYLGNYQSQTNMQTIVYSHNVVYTTGLRMGKVTWTASSSSSTVSPDSIFFEDTSIQTLLQVFINNNPGQVSLTILHNNATVIAYNQNRFQVLDAVATIPLILEVQKKSIQIKYAHQQNLGVIDPQFQISVPQVQKFYMPGVDLGFKDQQGSVYQVGSYVTLSYLAKTLSYFFTQPGTLTNTCPCFTEYLLGVVGVKNMNRMIQLYGLNQTNTTYPVSATLAVTNFKGLTKIKYFTFVGTMTAQIFFPLQQRIHQRLLSKTRNSQIILNNAYLSSNGPAAIQAYNNFATKSTTLQYATLLQNMNKATIQSQAAISIAQNLINPVGYYNGATSTGMQLWFETELLTVDAGVIVQNRDIFNAVGYSTLITPAAVNSTPSVLVKDIAFAFFVRQLTATQITSVVEQMNICITFMTAVPQFNLDLTALLSPSNNIV